MLPDTVDYLDDDQRRAYISLLILVASADGSLVREETAAIEGWMGRILLPLDQREDLRQLMRNPLGLNEILDNMHQTTLLLALRDATLLAACDGDYHQLEIEILEQIVDAAGLDSGALERLFKWVSEGWSWMVAGRAALDISMEGDNTSRR
jgi:tellurite resistance protein